MNNEDCKCICHFATPEQLNVPGGMIPIPFSPKELLKSCEHCQPEGKQRTTHIIKVGKNIQRIRLEFDEDGNFTEIAIDYGEPSDS